MKVAIVGTSHNMTENEERDVRQTVSAILKKYDPSETTIITGGAKGVDTIAGNIALTNMFAIQPILPMGIGWKYNKVRNIEIANQCNELYCITIPYYKNCKRKKCYHHKSLQDHQKTAGCYTLRKAEDQKKPVTLIVTQRRY